MINFSSTWTKVLKQAQLTRKSLAEQVEMSPSWPIEYQVENEEEDITLAESLISVKVAKCLCCSY